MLLPKNCMQERGCVCAMRQRPQLQVCGALQGMTPLHHAAMSGNMQQVQALLAHGADIHAQATVKLTRKVSPCLFCEQHPCTLKLSNSWQALQGCHFLFKSF